jgi:hypothetical protein
MAQTANGKAIVITHQTEGDTSLFLTGLTDDGGPASPSTPSMQYIIDAGLPLGGDGIADIPHDPASYGCQTSASCPNFPNPALLETNNTTAELNVIRYYPDDGTIIIPDAAAPDANLGTNSTNSSLQRPFIEVERTYPITTLSSGTDSRGIAFDYSQRLRCEHQFPYPSVEWEQCGQIPARTFIANRSPNVLILGTAGGPEETNPSSFDADQISLTNQAVLDGGASRVYLAPIIDADGDYALRVFVVCYDQNSIDVVNPDTQQTEAFIPVGQGPFALTFDPYAALDVALGRHVAPNELSFTPADGGTPVSISLPSYRFAYVASFTNSFVQVIDLDDSQPDKSTFETVVYTLGTPSVPVGNQ